MINYDFLFALDLVEGRQHKSYGYGCKKKSHGFLFRFAGRWYHLEERQKRDMGGVEHEDM